MEAQIIQISDRKRRQYSYPVAVYNAWVDFGNAMTRAWIDLFRH